MDNQQRRLCQFAALWASIILTATASILASFEEEPEPYHTSILTGHGWVLELLAGHPERICCELGVSHDVFAELISDLCRLGHTNSRYVSLEEQLAIFLYCCVTGLTIRHVGERFQRSNETISRYLVILSVIRYFSHIYVVIFERCFSFSHHHHSIRHMYANRLPIILLLMKF
jgi:hypothetical protein